MHLPITGWKRTLRTLGYKVIRKPFAKTTRRRSRQKSESLTFSTLEPRQLLAATPQLFPIQNQLVNEGQSFIVTASWSDTDTGDSHSASIDWGDGHVEAIDATFGEIEATHTYEDDALFTPVLTITDRDNLSDQSEFEVEVQNVAPSVQSWMAYSHDQFSDFYNGSYHGLHGTLVEGSEVSLSASFYDPSLSDDFSARFYVDGVLQDDADIQTNVYRQSNRTRISLDYDYVIPDAGAQNLTLELTDDDGGTTSHTYQVNPIAHGPAVTVTAPTATVDEGDAYTIEIDAIEIGNDPITSLEVDWGDGTGWQELATTATSATYVYTDNGQFDVQVRAASQDGTAIGRLTADSSFGDGGVVYHEVLLNHHQPQAVAEQPDGKVVVAGYGRQSNSGDYDLFLTRYLPNGEVDPSFGNNGVVLTDFFSDSSDTITSLGIQTLSNDSLRILVGGYANSNFIIAGYNEQGQLDSSFDGDGKVAVNVSGSSEYLEDLQVLNDGSFVVAGYAYINGTRGSDFAIVKFNQDGSRATEFGNNGIVLTDFGSQEYGGAIAIDGNSLIIAGDSGGNALVARYDLATGALDPSFGTGGKVEIDRIENLRVADVIVQDDGRIILATIDGTLLRLTANGQLDTEFGVDGVTADNLLKNTSKIHVDSAGRILLTGGTNGYTLAAVRYHSEGTLDTSYGNQNSIAQIHGDVSYSSARASTMLSDDSLILIANGTNYDSENGKQYLTIIAKLLPDNKVTVKNVAPSVSGWWISSYDQFSDFYNGSYHGLHGTLVEGSEVSLSASFYDPSLSDDFSAQFYVDGVLQGDADIQTNVYRSSTQTGISLNHKYIIPDAGAQNLTLELTDDDGGTTSHTYQVNPIAHGPAVTVTAPTATVDEGDAFTIEIDAIEIGNDPITSLEVDWGDGTGWQELATTATSATYVYTDNGQFDVQVRAASQDGTAIGRLTADSSFGDGGVVYHEVLLNYHQPQAVAEQPDGKVVVAGYGRQSNSGDYDLFLTRYLPNGEVDPSFGNNGVVLTDFFSDSSDTITSLGIQTLSNDSLRILVGGYANSNFIIAGYNEQGQLDSSFDGDGKVAVNVSGSSEYLEDLQVLNDGSFVVAGYAYINGTRGSDFAIVKFNQDGSRATEFGNNGIVLTDFGSQEYGGAIAIDGNSLIIAGDSGGNALVAHYDLATGALDPSFGTGGKVEINRTQYLNVVDVIVQDDGHIVLATRGGTLLRLTTSGQLDTEFGVDGVTADNLLKNTSKIHVDSAGRILLTGGTNGYTLAAVRYHSEGTLDTSYGNQNSIAQIHGDVSYSSARASTMLSDDSLILIANGTNYDSENGKQYLTIIAKLLPDNKVTVKNVAPSVSGWWISSYDQFSDFYHTSHHGGGYGTLFEGSEVSLSASFYDPSLSDDFSAQFYVDGVLQGDADIQTNVYRQSNRTRISLNHKYIIPDAGAQNLTLELTDDDGGTTSHTYQVNPIAHGPAVTVTAPTATVDEGDAFTIEIDAIEIGNDPITSLEVDWGDGTGWQELATTATSATYVYTDNGQFDVQVRAASQDGTAIGRLTADSSFGDGGVVYHEVLLNYHQPQAVAEQPDGKVVVAGYGRQSNGDDYDLFLTRYLPNGEVDPSFGNNGVVLTDFFSDSSDTITSLGIQTLSNDSLRILVGGYANSNFIIAGYNEQGQLDSSFDGDGKVAVNVSSFSESLHDLQILDNGSFVVAGHAYVNTQGHDFAIVKFNQDGSRDTGFGNNGIVLTDFPSGSLSEYGKAITVDDDSLIVAGDSNSNALVARYDLATGALDPSFGTGGKVKIDRIENLQVADVIVQDDGRIILATRHSTLLRLTANGQLDTEFGVDGVNTDSQMSIKKMHLDAAGRILLTGTSNRLLTTVRLHSDGTLDTSYGNQDGRAQVYSGSDYSYAQASTILSDGSVLLVADGQNNGLENGTQYLTLLAKLLPDNKVTVKNVAPAVVPNSSWGFDTGLQESSGGDAELGVTFVDPSPSDSYTVLFDPGDGTEPFETGFVWTHSVNGQTRIQAAEYDFAYQDDGQYAASFSITDDDGGVAVYNDTVTIVNSVPQSAPVLAPVQVDLRSGQHYQLQLQDIGYSDADGTPIGSLRIDSVPTDGELRWFDLPVLPGQLFDAWELEAGLITYIAPNSDFGDSQDLIGITATSGGLESNTATLRMVVTVPNEAATLNPVPVEPDGEVYYLTLDDLGYSDLDGDPLSEIRIDSYPSNGDLSVSVGQTVTAAELQNGALSFTYYPWFRSDPPGDSFLLSASDGKLFGESAQFTFLEVNNTNPTLQPSDLDAEHAQSVTLNIADFGYQDADGDPLEAIRFSSLPSRGLILNDGVPVDPNESIPAIDIASGLLAYVADSSFQSAHTVYLNFQASDARDWTGSSLQVNVKEKNLAPALSPVALNLDSEAKYVFAIDDFDFSDPNLNDELQSIRIGSIPLYGVLKRGDDILGVDDVLSQDSIAQGEFTYTPLRGVGISYQDQILIAAGDGAIDSPLVSLTIDFSASETSGLGIENVDVAIESYDSGSGGGQMLTLSISGNTFGDVSRVEFNRWESATPIVESWTVTGEKFQGTVTLPTYQNSFSLRWIGSEGYVPADDDADDQGDLSDAEPAIQGEWISYPIDVELPSELKPLSLEIAFVVDQGPAGYSQLDRVRLVGKVEGVASTDRVEIELDSDHNESVDEQFEYLGSGDDHSFDEQLSAGTDTENLHARIAVYSDGNANPFRTSWVRVYELQTLTDPLEAPTDEDENNSADAEDNAAEETVQSDSDGADQQQDTDSRNLFGPGAGDFSGGSLENLTDWPGPLPASLDIEVVEFPTYQAPEPGDDSGSTTDQETPDLTPAREEMQRNTELALSTYQFDVDQAEQVFEATMSGLHNDRTSDIESARDVAYPAPGNLSAFEQDVADRKAQYEDEVDSENARAHAEHFASFKPYKEAYVRALNLWSSDARWANNYNAKRVLYTLDKSLADQLAIAGSAQFKAWKDAEAALAKADSNDLYERSIRIAELDAKIHKDIAAAEKEYLDGKIEAERVRDNALATATRNLGNRRADIKETFKIAQANAIYGIAESRDAGGPPDLDQVNGEAARDRAAAAATAARNTNNADLVLAKAQNDATAIRLGTTAAETLAETEKIQDATIVYQTNYFNERKSQAAMSIDRSRDAAKETFNINAAYKRDIAEVEYERLSERLDISEPNAVIDRKYERDCFDGVNSSGVCTPEYSLAHAAFKEQWQADFHAVSVRLLGKAPFETPLDDAGESAEDGDPTTAKAVMKRFKAFSQIELNNSSSASSAAKSFTDANAGWVKTYNESVNTARDERRQAVDVAGHAAEVDYADAVEVWAESVLNSELTLVSDNAATDAIVTSAVAQSQSSILVSAASDHADAVEAFSAENPGNPAAARDASNARAEATHLQGALHNASASASEAANKRRDYIVATAVARASYTIDVIASSMVASVEVSAASVTLADSLRGHRTTFNQDAIDAFKTHEGSISSISVTVFSDRNDARYKQHGKQLEAYLDFKYDHADGSDSYDSDRIAKIAAAGDEYFDKLIVDERTYQDGITTAKKTLGESLTEKLRIREDGEADENETFAEFAIDAGADHAKRTTDRAELMLTELADLQKEFQLAILSQSSSDISALAAANQGYTSDAATADSDYHIAMAGVQVDAVANALALDHGGESTHSDTDGPSSDPSPSDDYHQAVAQANQTWTTTAAPVAAAYESAIAAASFSYITELLETGTQTATDNTIASHLQSTKKIKAAAKFQSQAIELARTASKEAATAGKVFVKDLAAASESFAVSLLPVLISNRNMSLDNSAVYENSAKPHYRDELIGDLVGTLDDSLQSSLDDLQVDDAERQRDFASGLAGVINAWGDDYVLAAKDYTNETAKADAKRISGLNDALLVWSQADNAADAAYTIAVGDAQATLATGAAQAATAFTQAAGDHWMTAMESFTTADEAHSVSAAEYSMDFIIDQASAQANIETPVGADSPTGALSSPTGAAHSGTDFDALVSAANLQYLQSVREPYVAAAQSRAAAAKTAAMATAMAAIGFDDTVASESASVSSTLANSAAAANTQAAIAIEKLANAAAEALHAHVSQAVTKDVLRISDQADKIAIADAAFLTAQTNKYKAAAKEAVRTLKVDLGQDVSDTVAVDYLDAFADELANASYTLAAGKITPRTAYSNAIAGADKDYVHDMAEAIATAESSLADITAQYATAAANAQKSLSHTIIAETTAYEIDSVNATATQIMQDVNTYATLITADYDAASDAYLGFSDSSSDSIQYQIAIAAGNATWATLYAGHYAAWQGAVTNAYSGAAIQNITAWSDAARGAVDASTSREIAAANSAAMARGDTATAILSAQRLLADATYGNTTARANASRDRDLALEDVQRDAEIEDTEMDSSINRLRIDAAIASFSGTMSTANGTLASSSQSARDLYRSGLTSVDRQSAYDSADRRRDHDLAIIDLTEIFGTKVTINNTQAELTVAAADYVWEVGKIDAEIAGAAVSAGVFPSPQTQVSYQRLQDQRSDKVSDESQRLTDRSVQITADQTTRLAEISADAADDRTRINSSHSEEIAIAGQLERTGTIHIATIETPQAVRVSDVSSSAFRSTRARETAVSRLAGAHDYGGLSGKPKLPWLASASYTRIEVYLDDLGMYREFDAQEMRKGAGTVIQPPAEENRDYSYQVGDDESSTTLVASASWEDELESDSDESESGDQPETESGSARKVDVSNDPIGFAAGDANLYRNGGNGPTNAIDPSGLVGVGPLSTNTGVASVIRSFQEAQKFFNLWGNTEHMGLAKRLYVVGGTLLADTTGVRGVSDACSQHDAFDGHRQSTGERVTDGVFGGVQLVLTAFAVKGVTGSPVSAGAAGNSSPQITSAIREAAKRLGFNEETIQVVGKQIRGRIKHTDTFARADFEDVLTKMRHSGATEAVCETGPVINKGVAARLARKAGEGKPFMKDGVVVFIKELPDITGGTVKYFEIIFQLQK